MCELDVDACLEILTELIRNDGDPVYSYHWDSGNPGAGAWTDFVFKYRDRYWFDGSDGMAGPYDSLMEALPDEFGIGVTSATVSVTSSEMDSGDIIDLLRPMDLDEAVTITVNGGTVSVSPDGKTKKRTS
jgi:hypothetical protein